MSSRGNPQLTLRHAQDKRSDLLITTGDCHESLWLSRNDILKQKGDPLVLSTLSGHRSQALHFVLHKLRRGRGGRRRGIERAGRPYYLLFTAYYFSRLPLLITEIDLFPPLTNHHPSFKQSSASWASFRTI